MLRVKGGKRPPWMGLGAAVWVQICSGNGYTFPLYSHSLKSVLGFNQSQITLLGVANDIGENLGILPGLACNKFPPWRILLIGGLLSFLGFGVLWLSISKTFDCVPFIVTSVRHSITVPAGPAFAASPTASLNVFDNNQNP
ncbi:uncharacterized protein HKW66_Vig0006370 [Vigna angularis]|uniref:Nodulin-like domain-containing protein n=1 Tax=Phaseolus angularis TaxID=3914 RepID=A0A8T0LED6_PHAAN|nr:uncharacterized protein HKW66_Vig0006370 [Vigna angularis]